MASINSGVSIRLNPLLKLLRRPSRIGSAGDGGADDDHLRLQGQNLLECRQFHTAGYQQAERPAGLQRNCASWAKGEPCAACRS